MTRAEATASTRTQASVIVCADDYALHPSVDQAVLLLARAGRLSATSCMSTAPGWPKAAKALQALRPALSVGLHFNLTESHAGAVLAHTLGQVLRAAYTRTLSRTWVQAAWRAQLDAFEQALGCAPDYLDGHQHVHQMPIVRDCMLEELSRRYGPGPMPWVRSTRPAGTLWRSPKAAAIACLGGWRTARLLQRAGIAMNHGFAGVYGFDADNTDAYRIHMRRWLAQMPRSGGLLMCHPATDAVPGDAIAAQRIVEFEYLASHAFEQDLAQAGLRVHLNAAQHQSHPTHA